VDLQTAIVVDETQLPKPVHKKFTQHRTAEQLPCGGVEKALLGKARANIEAGHLTFRVDAVGDRA